MRIQWSSSAAQEMIGRLEKTEWSVLDCLRQSSAVRAALAEANPDGEDRALRKAAERYALLARRLRTFEEALEAFLSAVRKADAMFEDAEAELGRIAIGLSDAQGAPGGSRCAREPYIRWEPAAYSVLPDERVPIAPVPDWLRMAVAETSAIPYMV